MMKSKMNKVTLSIKPESTVDVSTTCQPDHFAGDGVKSVSIDLGVSVSDILDADDPSAFLDRQMLFAAQNMKAYLGILEGDSDKTN